MSERSYDFPCIVRGELVSRDDVLLAFNSVCDKENWKMPIEALVNGDADLDLIRAAVVYFTGSVPTFDPVDPVDNTTLIFVRAAGYYNAIGA